jgi:transcriptional regulator with XRE-family HTH domain
VNMRVEDLGVERSRVDADRLLLAVLAVKSKDQLTVAGLSRATGVARSTLSTFLTGRGMPTGNDIIAILGWMHMDPTLVMFPVQPKQAAPDPAEGGEQEAATAA